MQINAGTAVSSHIFSMRYLFNICLTFTVVASLSGGASSAEHPSWEGQITVEALDAVNCEVSFISHIVEREMQTGTMVMAKVHCVDNRSFDALRENDAMPFTFKECTPRDTKSC